MLGVTVPNVNAWVLNRAHQERPKSCLVKVYDDLVRHFKLNDNVTFIGVLEMQKSGHKGDEEMKDESAGAGSMYEDFVDIGGTGIPNENQLPHLHAITFKQNSTIHNTQILRKSDVSSNSLTEHEVDISEARDKLIAILKLILNND